MCSLHNSRLIKTTRTFWCWLTIETTWSTCSWMNPILQPPSWLLENQQQHPKAFHYRDSGTRPNSSLISWEMNSLSETKLPTTKVSSHILSSWRNVDTWKLSIIAVINNNSNNSFNLLLWWSLPKAVSTLFVSSVHFYCHLLKVTGLRYPSWNKWNQLKSICKVILKREFNGLLKLSTMRVSFFSMRAAV